MPNELSFHGTTGATYYAVARQGANAYEENSEQYVPELLASRNGYALPMTETPAGGGRFLGDAPASLPVGEVHEVAVYRQAGASPDGEADGEAVGVAMLFWDGLVFAPAADGARISLLDRLRTRGPTIYVSPDGDDAYAGTLRGRAKATLAAGLAALADGGTLVVARGYYSEAGLELANSGCRVLFEPGVALSESLGGTPGLVVSGDDNMIEGHWYVSLGDTAETAVRISGDRNWLTGSLGINTCGVGLDLTGSANRVESVSVREPRTAGVRVTGEENRVGRAAVNPGSGGYPNAKSVLLAAGAARNVIARCSGGQAFAAETGADDNDIIDCAGPGYTDAGEGNLWPGWHEAPALASADIPTAADNATAAANAILLTPANKLATDVAGKILAADGSITNSTFATDAINSGAVATTAAQEIAGWVFRLPEEHQGYAAMAEVLANLALASLGTGARTVTLTVTDGSTPLAGARVRVTEGTESYVGSTDADGEITFSLDDATWTVAITKPGYQFTPTTLAVAADTEATYSMSAVVVETPTPSTPGSYSRY